MKNVLKTLTILALLIATSLPLAARAESNQDNWEIPQVSTALFEGAQAEAKLLGLGDLDDVNAARLIAQNNLLLSKLSKYWSVDQAETVLFAIYNGDYEFVDEAMAIDAYLLPVVQAYSGTQDPNLDEISKVGAYLVRTDMMIKRAAHVDPIGKGPIQPEYFKHIDVITKALQLFDTDDCVLKGLQEGLSLEEVLKKCNFSGAGASGGAGNSPLNISDLDPCELAEKYKEMKQSSESSEGTPVGTTPGPGIEVDFDDKGNPVGIKEPTIEKPFGSACRHMFTKFYNSPLGASDPKEQEEEEEEEPTTYKPIKPSDMQTIGNDKKDYSKIKSGVKGTKWTKNKDGSWTKTTKEVGTTSTKNQDKGGYTSTKTTTTTTESTKAGVPTKKETTVETEQTNGLADAHEDFKQTKNDMKEDGYKVSPEHGFTTEGSTYKPHYSSMKTDPDGDIVDECEEDSIEAFLDYACEVGLFDTPVEGDDECSHDTTDEEVNPIATTITSGTKGGKGGKGSSGTTIGTKGGKGNSGSKEMIQCDCNGNWINAPKADMPELFNPCDKENLEAWGLAPIKNDFWTDPVRDGVKTGLPGLLEQLEDDRNN